MNSEVKTQFEEAWERVKEVTGWRDYKDLAAFVGSSPQSISGVKKRGKFPLEWARKIASEFRILTSTDYIMDGSDYEWRTEARMHYEATKRLRPSAAGTATYMETAAELLRTEYVLVPRYELAASAGGGAIIHSDQIVDHLAFKYEWVKNVMGLSEKDLALINVKGDSMEPTLSNGDLILVDLRARQLGDNAIYVLQFNGVLLVKRVQRRMDGTVMIKSDNLIYEPEIVNGERADVLNVIGRVVWCGRKM